jgi:hypothetical protein
VRRGLDAIRKQGTEPESGLLYQGGAARPTASLATRRVLRALRSRRTSSRNADEATSTALFRALGKEQFPHRARIRCDARVRGERR